METSVTTEVSAAIQNVHEWSQSEDWTENAANADDNSPTPLNNFDSKKSSYARKR